MSIREIKKHTSSEIIAMIIILGRMNLMESGSMLDAQSKAKQPIRGTDVRTYTKYLEEIEKLKTCIPAKEENEDFDEEVEFDQP